MRGAVYGMNRPLPIPGLQRGNFVADPPSSESDLTLASHVQYVLPTMQHTPSPALARLTAGTILLASLALSNGCALVYEKDVPGQNCDGQTTRVYEWGFFGGLLPVYRKVGPDASQPPAPPCPAPEPNPQPSTEPTL
jgi:hypothetical protein